MKPKTSLAGFFAPFLTVCVATITLILTDSISTLAYDQSEYSLEHQGTELESRIKRVRQNSDSSQFNQINGLSQGYHIPPVGEESLALKSEQLTHAAWNNWANWANWRNWQNW